MQIKFLLAQLLIPIFRMKFRGITSKPDFCQAIYQSLKNQQANSAAILTAGEEQNNGEKGIHCNTASTNKNFQQTETEILGWAGLNLKIPEG